MAFVIAVVVESEGCCSHCDHGGDVAVVTVCIKVIVFVVIVVGAVAVKDVVAFDGNVVVVFIVVVVVEVECVVDGIAIKGVVAFDGVVVVVFIVLLDISSWLFVVL